MKTTAWRSVVLFTPGDGNFFGRPPTILLDCDHKINVQGVVNRATPLMMTCEHCENGGTPQGYTPHLHHHVCPECDRPYVSTWPYQDLCAFCHEENRSAMRAAAQWREDHPEDEA